jgi:hypothetical protein
MSFFYLWKHNSFSGQNLIEDKSQKTFKLSLVQLKGTLEGLVELQQLGAKTGAHVIDLLIRSH